MGSPVLRIRHILKRYWLVGIFLLYFAPRLVALGSDMANIDTMYWYPRMDKFTDAMVQGNFKGSYQQYHPGTTLLWMSGSAKYSFEAAYESKYGFKPSIYPHHFTKIQFVSTFPLVFIISILGALSAKYLAHFMGKRFALLFSVLLGFEPFFYGISKYLHLTALSTMFGFVAFLVAVHSIQSKRYKDIVFSGILLGLGISTKISVLSLWGIILLILFFSDFSLRKLSLPDIVTRTKKCLMHTVAMSVTFVVVNPFMWVAPLWGIRKIWKQGVVNTGFGGGMPDTITDSKYLFYIETAFLRTSPLVFLAGAAGIAIVIWYLTHKRKTPLLLRASFLYLFLYVLLLTVPSKLKDRYYVEIMPVFVVFAAYGFYRLLELKRKLLTGFIVLVYIVIHVSIIYRYYPAYSFYHTELVGGPKGYFSLGIRPTNRGEWYAQAAQYLNTYSSKPEGKNALMGNESLVKTFSQFFYGTTYAELGAIPDNKGYKVDYIITRNDNQKYVPHDFCKPLKQFGVRGPFAFNNVFVFECKNILKDDLTKLIPTFPDY